MIHPDVAVAVGGQAADRIKHDVDLFHRGGQVRGQNPALRLKVIGQVRIVVKRDTVGREFNHLINRLFKGLPGLLGQPVDKIHVDRVKAVGAGLLHQIARHLKGLNAVNRLLHVRIKVLNTETHAVKARTL